MSNYSIPRPCIIYFYWFCIRANSEEPKILEGISLRHQTIKMNVILVLPAEFCDLVLVYKVGWSPKKLVCSYFLHFWIDFVKILNFQVKLRFTLHIMYSLPIKLHIILNGVCSPSEGIIVKILLKFFKWDEKCWNQTLL